MPLSLPEPALDVAPIAIWTELGLPSVPAFVAPMTCSGDVLARVVATILPSHEVLSRTSERL